MRHETVTAILHGLGHTAYSWSLNDDRLQWCSNAPQVLGLDNVESVRFGRDFERMVALDAGHPRRLAVHGGRLAAPGASVAFETVYRLHPTRLGAGFWVEDKGVWLAGPTGEPVEVRGIVRRLAESSVGSAPAAEASPVVRLGRGEAGFPSNRQYLTRVLEHGFADLRRGGGEFGFLLFNIDNVSKLNDAYGYAVADEIIELAGHRLREAAGTHAVGRFSSNKFGIALMGGSSDTLAGCAQRCLRAIAERPLQSTRGAVAITATAGGVSVPRHASDVAEAFAHAFDALEHAKFIGRGSFFAYTPSPERDAHRRANLRLTDDIVLALSNRDVCLAYQPIAHTASRRIDLYECLVRIRGADRHLLSGADIVPVAERCGIMHLLDHRVLELALDTLEANTAVRLSVNISPNTIHDAGWLSLLEARRRVGERLTIEITETAAIHDLGRTQRFVNRLHDFGCKVAMDDFGAGYTSFRNLRLLGIDMLKIDGSFIAPLLTSPDDQAFVRTLLSLAAHLGITTVAEWVPDEKTAAQLQEWGCDYLQGAVIGLASPSSPVNRMAAC
ncbi:bifunctional diguanylate cyclase/phosphodiesterase [Ancylobacter lacus]|uniref:bifunctional diguanylate cyclase/phosphodiesterase n=1 Tax=Ancylobacter lacus TaxID=2579970 RepID=UPI001BCD2DDB|nr:bifunctional diguanylate cyclase/phosphodiesterase [Ancylobacter lacus]MBS7541124.1 bifunctional diguanylate cyclase/phosphodiesterase [Ancylobacter lacus]